MSRFSLIIIIIFSISCGKTQKQNKEEWDRFYNGELKFKPKVKLDYYPGDSQIKRLERFNDVGLTDGIKQTFYENGNLKTLKYYKNNVQNGINLVFSENGALVVSENYINGRKNGWSYGFYETGEKRFEIFWKEDELIDAIEYNLDGNVVYGKEN